MNPFLLKLLLFIGIQFYPLTLFIVSIFRKYCTLDQRNPLLVKTRHFLTCFYWVLIYFERRTIKDLFIDEQYDLNQILVLCYLTFLSITLNFVWAKPFTLIYIRYTDSKKTDDSPQLEATIQNKSDIKKLYEFLNGEYLTCSIESFHCLIKQKPLLANDRIKWININPTDKNDINRQTLIHLVVMLFPILSKKTGKYSKVDLDKIILDYFQTKNGESIRITGRTFQAYKDNKSKPLHKFNKQLENLI